MRKKPVGSRTRKNIKSPKVKQSFKNRISNHETLKWRLKSDNEELEKMKNKLDETRVWNYDGEDTIKKAKQDIQKQIDYNKDEMNEIDTSITWLKKQKADLPNRQKEGEW